MRRGRAWSAACRCARARRCVRATGSEFRRVIHRGLWTLTRLLCKSLPRLDPATLDEPRRLATRWCLEEYGLRSLIGVVVKGSGGAAVASLRAAMVDNPRSLTEGEIALVE